MKCKECNEDVYHVRWKRCKKHYRFKQMIYQSKSSGKEVPTPMKLEELFLKGMKCPSCGITMELLFKYGSGKTLSLQHDRNGDFKFLCMGCNTRHSDYPGDLFYSRKSGFKFCHDCKRELPLSEFHKDKSRSNGHDSYCKECSVSYQLNRYKKNREQILKKSKERYHNEIRTS